MEKTALYKVLVFHVLVLISLYVLLYSCGILQVFPNTSTLLKWDSNWYNSIVQNGYSYSDKIQSNAGFFPLFPLMWKALSLNAFEISIFNAVIALISISLLAQTFLMKRELILLFLSLPSIFFLYVPYAESLFFLGSTLLLIGLKKEQKAFSIIGLLIATMAKATALFFIPAIVFMVLFERSLKDISLPALIKESLLLLLCVLFGMGLVVLIQYYQTGAWFAYFKAQSMHWNRKFSIPVFPLTTWDAARLITLDASAFLVGLLSLGACFRILLNWLASLNIHSNKQDKSYLLSCSFLFLVLCSIVFFNPIDAATKTTSILSINRYMFATPFLMVFMLHHYKHTKLSTQQLIGAVVLIGMVWLVFHAYSGFKIASLFILLTMYLSGFLALLWKEKLSLLWIPLYMINCIIQLILFHSFMNGKWVG
ncbi:MAG: hypothetical protein IPP32_04425 [Bacteroidetes bacterium]|nr:hypothetical protein [Bacteroidota bacterium]